MKPELQSEKGVACRVLSAPLVPACNNSRSNKAFTVAIEADSDRKCRRRPARRSRQVRQHLENDGCCSYSNIGRREWMTSIAEDLNGVAPLRNANASPSPSYIPNTNLEHKFGGSSDFPAPSLEKLHTKLDRCSSGIATSACLKHDRSGAISVAFRSPVGNDLAKSMPVTPSEYAPSTSTCRFHELSPVQTCKPKLQDDVLGHTKPKGDSSLCATNFVTKIDCRRQNAQKDAMLSCRVDPLQSTSGSRCGCAGDTPQPSTLLLEESLEMGNRPSGVEMPGAGSPCSGLRSNRSASESPGARCLRYKALPKHNLKGEGDFGQGISYAPYWPLEKVSQALESGLAFCSKLRVNMHNRNEAYISLEGVPTDILIDGLQAQNRAIDGDVVAFVLNPLPSWPRLKGFLKKQNSGDQVTELFVQSPPIVLQEASGDEGFSDAGETGLEDRLEDVSGETRHRISLDVNDENSCFHEGFQASDLVNNCASRVGEIRNATKALALLRTHMSSLPDKRPTGKVVAIIEKSRRRETVIGFMEVHSRFTNNVWGKGYCATQKDSCDKLSKEIVSFTKSGSIMLLPSDNRLPKMFVCLNTLPDYLKKRFWKGDLSLRYELVAAKIDRWEVDSFAPAAIISHAFGKGGDIKAQAAAILFEHAIHSVEFPLDALSCLPKTPWAIPTEEFSKRRDLRDHRIFTIDPSTSRDLDDALSVEFMSNDIVRVGIHISDVSFFVHPDTALDKEAQVRSTSVYLTQYVMPMLPQVLCEEICSLNPGVDHLAFSVFCDLNTEGNIINHWVGRTIIRSCCKLTYQHVQKMIEDVGMEGINSGCNSFLPELYGGFNWREVIDDVKSLHEIAKKRREHRFKAGALRLESSKLVFVLDEDGVPYDSMLSKHVDSNFLVEEFMLLANMTAAKVISRAFPECALLRRHPEPSRHKLKELEEFCYKNGFELDVSSFGALHESLRKLGEELRGDPSLCSILMLYATKPMQLAKYFCTGQLKDREDDWAHYSLAVSFYTHFTSPIRRYADIVVHRTLAAAIEAEEILSESCLHSTDRSKPAEVHTLFSENQCKTRWFTGLTFNKEVAHSAAGKVALATAASKHKVPGCMVLNVVAEHCNERRLASRNVMDATDKLYLWAMLKRKQRVLSDARVLTVGPKFLSLYISGIAMERRIYYDDTEGLQIEWLEATGTVVLDLASQMGTLKKNRHGKNRTVDDVAFVVNPAYYGSVNLDNETSANAIHKVQESFYENCEMNGKTDSGTHEDLSGDKKVLPLVLPLTLRLLSPVTVSVYAVGGENGPLDIAVRLYLSSYLYQSPVS